MSAKCIECGVELTIDNWYPSFRERNRMACKECDRKRARLWRTNNKDKTKAAWTRHSRKIGMQPFDKNKNCPLYLGVHIAEKLLSRVFKDVERMPINNPGYDIICNHGKLIDVKISSLLKNGSWLFGIRRNTIADYFLCMAINNREEVVPLHLWFLPGNTFNHLMSTGISESTINKWDEYRLDIDKAVSCCSAMKKGKT